jgi:hypothetical protein
MLHGILQRFPVAVGLVALTCALLVENRAQAFFHQWRFAEFFSTADGNVQFIELHTTGLSEIFATGVQIRSASTGNVFTFDHNLSGSTANKDLLIATAGFGALPGGVAPDFGTVTNPLPANFFNPAGDTLKLCQSTCTLTNLFDTRTFASVPTDGVFSRIYPSDTTAANSPKNFGGAFGSVNRGDYNANGVVDAGDYVVWRKTLTLPASPAGSGADGDTSGTIDAGDLTVWRSRFTNVLFGAAAGAGQSAGVPEPATLVLFSIGLVLLAQARRRVA